MDGKKFYWLKLDRKFFKRHDIRIVESLPNGKDYILFYLKLLCESVNHAGELRFSETIPYSEQMLSVVTDTNVDIVRAALATFRELGMIEVLDDGTLFLAEVNKMIGSAADNDNANRQRAFRERQKALALQACYEPVTKDNESKRKSKNKSKSIEIDIFKVFADGDDEMYQMLKDFEEMRKKKGKPMTNRAKQMLVNKLETFPKEKRKPCLERSIFNAWSSVYEDSVDMKRGTVLPTVEELKSEETDRLLRLTKEMGE